MCNPANFVSSPRCCSDQESSVSQAEPDDDKPIHEGKDAHPEIELPKQRTVDTVRETRGTNEDQETESLAMDDPNLAVLTAPLTNLVGNSGFKWNQEEESAFQAVKLALAQPLTLSRPDPRYIILQTDASTLGMGAVVY